MWSHYAKGHTGVRIKFYFRPELFVKRGLVQVRYRNKTPTWRSDEFPIEDIRTNFAWKSSVWKYEREYRWILADRTYKSKGEEPYFVIEEQGKFFLSMHPRHILTIDLGVDISDEDRRTVFSKVKEINAASKIRTRDTVGNPDVCYILQVRQAYFLPGKYELTYKVLESEKDVLELEISKKAMEEKLARPVL